MLEFVVLVGITVVGIAVHELAHAAACHYYGVRWWPTIHWGRYIPHPAIGSELHDHTPRSLRNVALAPLLMYIPAVVIFAVFGPRTVIFEWEIAGAALMMWCLCAFPSGVDWKIVRDASDLEMYHAVWNGDHTSHRLAEGIAE